MLLSLPHFAFSGEALLLICPRLKARYFLLQTLKDNWHGQPIEWCFVGNKSARPLEFIKNRIKALPERGLFLVTLSWLLKKE
jgi:hypothetical protein